MVSGHEDLLNISNYKLAATYSRITNRGEACILIKNTQQLKQLSYVVMQSISGVLEMGAIEFLSCF